MYRQITSLEETELLWPLGVVWIWWTEKSKLWNGHVIRHNWKPSPESRSPDNFWRKWGKDIRSGNMVVAALVEDEGTECLSDERSEGG